MTTCWIVTEGMAGTENQCLGVADALGLEPVVKRIRLQQPWKTLSPFLGHEQYWSFRPRLEGPWPDLLLTSGRKAIAAARYIKKASDNKTFTVQIQDPRISTRYFDMVAVPEHDPARGENVTLTTAAPNRVTPDRLQEAKKHFEHLFSPISRPRVAVLIGGNSKAYEITEEVMRNFCAALKGLDKNGAGLMVTASRRTGKGNQKILHDALQDTNAFTWDGQGENPYFGFLAWADYILVTADSVSMISEASATGKPVYMVPLPGGTERFRRFHGGLLQKGIIRLFEGNLEEWRYNPLNDAEIIADAIRKRLNI
jgi:uncharacterized protein